MARATWALAALLLLLGGAAKADDRAEAKAASIEGSRRYAVGDFRGALEAFKASYLQYEAPETLFNIGQCHRQLGNHAEAARSYRNYLDLAANARDRDEVERLLAEEEAAAAKAPQVVPEKPTPKPDVKPAPAPTPAPAAGEKKSRAWVVVLVAALVAVAGAAIGITLALTLRHEEPDPTNTIGVQMVSFP